MPPPHTDMGFRIMRCINADWPSQKHSTELLEILGRFDALPT